MRPFRTRTANRRLLRRATALLAAAGAIAGLAACGSSGSSRTSAATNPTANSGPSNPSQQTGTPSHESSDPGTSSASAGTTGTTGASGSPTSSTSSAPTAPGCPTDNLGIRVIRGGGVTGHEYALIMFTNQSSVTCALTGFPGVSLRSAGGTLGQPAVRTSKSFSPVTLAPGAMAQSSLVVSTTCQAAISQTVRVYPPNQKSFVDLPLRVRGCSSTIDPVVPA